MSERRECEFSQRFDCSLCAIGRARTFPVATEKRCARHCRAERQGAPDQYQKQGDLHVVIAAAALSRGQL